MKHRHVLVVLVLAIGLLPHPAFSQSTPAEKPNAALLHTSECVAEKKRLDVLLLVDASGSLKKTDPLNKRVTAVNSALESLAGLAEHPIDGTNPTVNVALLTFGAKTTEVFGWNPINYGAVGGLKTKAGAIAELNKEWDTDYYDALAAAQAALETQTSNATTCSALLWFTDGEYDIEPRSRVPASAGLGSTKPYDSSIDIRTPEGAAKLEERGKSLLCEENGLVDSVRKRDVAMMTVALVNKDTKIAPEAERFLRSLATGQAGDDAARQTCGTVPAGELGYYVGVDDLSELVDSFDAIGNVIAFGTSVPGADNMGACSSAASCAEGSRTFAVPIGVTRVHVIVRTGRDGRAVTLRVPTLTDLSPAKGTTGNNTSNGINTRHAWLGVDVLTFDVDLPTTPSPVFGDWSVTITDGEGAPATSAAGYKLFFYSALQAKPAPEMKLSTGKRARMKFQVVGPDGAAVTAEYLNALDTVEGVVEFDAARDVQVPLGEVMEDGTFDSAVDLPEAVASLDPAVGKAKLRITTAGTTQYRLRPTGTTFSVPRCSTDCGDWKAAAAKVGGGSTRWYNNVALLGGVVGGVVLLGGLLTFALRRKPKRPVQGDGSVLVNPSGARCYAARVRVSADRVTFVTDGPDMPFSLSEQAFEDVLAPSDGASTIEVLGITLTSTLSGVEARKAGWQVVSSDGGAASLMATGGSVAPVRPTLAPIWLFAFTEGSIGRQTVARSAPLQPLPDAPIGPGGVAPSAQPRTVTGELLVTARSAGDVQAVLQSVLYDLPAAMAVVLQDQPQYR